MKALFEILRLLRKSLNMYVLLKNIERKRASAAAALIFFLDFKPL